MKGKLKSGLAILLAIVIAFSALAATTAFAVETEPLSSFAITAKGSGTDAAALGNVSWWKSDVDGKYYMFMPSNTDLSSVTVWFTATGDVTCNGVTLENGVATDAFANGGEFVLSASGTDYTVVFMTSSQLPSMFINTPEGGLDRIHADKDHKEKGCTMLAINDNGKVDYNSTLASMKGRGNSTWGYPKKPYNIKLDEKSKLFGMEKAKNWCLIANYGENSLLRNQLVYTMGALIGMTETPDCRSIDLYINGEYYGVYLITEKVEINKNRVDIFDLEEATEEANGGVDLSMFSPLGVRGKFSGYLEDTQRWYDIPNDPENITGGYLLELDFSERYEAEASGFVTENSQCVVIKSPEYASESQVQYISQYWQEFEDALYSSTGYNSQNKQLSDYIDIVSFAKAYLVQEWSSNWDVGLSSAFFYKDLDGKLFAGPLWDFDESLGNARGARDGVDLTDPKNIHAKTRNLFYDALMGSNNVKATPNIFALAYRHAEFAETVEDQMETTFVPAVQNLMNSIFDRYVNIVHDAAMMNAIRWNTYGTTDVAAIAEQYDAEIESIRDFINIRTEFLAGTLTLKNEGLTIEHIVSQKKTGKPITPALTVKCLDRVLTEGEDYTAEFSDNVDVGTATVVVTGIGKYEGMSASTTFKINAVSDPLDWTGGSGEARAKENLNTIGAGFVDGVECLLYSIVKLFSK